MITTNASAGKEANLSATGDIQLLAAANTSEMRSTSSGSNASMGATFALGGQQNGLSFQAGAQGSKGKANGDETTYTNTWIRVGSAEEPGTLNISSSGNTTLRGATASVTGSGGVLVASAERDANIIAGVISNTGQQSGTVAAAGRNLTLGTVQVAVQENNVRNSTNYLRQSTSEDIGSQVQAASSLRLQAGNDLNAKAATIETAGALLATAGNNINLTAGQSHQSFDEGRQRTDKGTLASKTISTRDQLERSDSLGTSVGGNTVTVIAGNDIKVSGSSVISDAATTLVAKNNLTIEAAQTTRDSASFRDEKTSGLFTGGGIGVTYGVKQQSLDSQAANTAAAASTVGSIGGNVTLIAGNQYRQVGSDVVAPGADISILAKKVDITEARETSQSATEQKFSQSGLTLAITSPVITALQTARQMGQAAGNTSSGRMKALAGASAALAVKGAADAVASNPGEAGGINLSLSIGASSSQSNTTSQSSSARGSSVAAGGNVVISATGAGEGSNLTVQGSRISAGGNATLMADNQIELLAAVNEASQKSSNKSSSGSIGVSVGTGGMGVTVSASAARGKSDGQDVTYSNTRVEAGNALRLQSGGDTTLKGAVVAGKTVHADIGGNLSIESLQDTSVYASQQASIGGSLTVGAGVSGSVSASSSKSSGNFASVTEQSGIQAGDGGFAVNVKGNTDLRGGVIASTEKAVQEGSNRLTTATLTTSDIQNKAEASAKSSGINLSSDMLSQGKYGAAKAVIGNALNTAGESGSSSGQTRSAVSAGAVTITDEAAQQATTGKTAGQTVASLNRNTAGAQTAAQKLDVQAMQQTVEAERAIKQEAVKQFTTLSDDAYRVMFKEKPQFYKVVCSSGADCTKNPEQAKTELVKGTPEQIQAELAKADKGAVLAVNGIDNPLERAAQLAMQNAEPVKDANGIESKPTTIYLMHYVPANNGISELMVAAYEKSLAPTLGYTNQDQAYADAIKARGNDETISLGHSRGTIVQTNANSILAEQGFTNSNLSVRGVGGAVGAQEFTDAAAKVTGADGKKNITFNYFSNDPVSVAAGSNPGVMSLSEFYKVLTTSNSAHSCYGTGSAGCAQVEILTPNALSGAKQDNSQLIQFRGGQQVDSNNNPVNK